MDMKQFIEDVRRTYPPYMLEGLRLQAGLTSPARRELALMGALGLADESFELADSLCSPELAVQELGDCLYYVVALADGMCALTALHELPVWETIPGPMNRDLVVHQQVGRLLGGSHGLLGMVKKSLFHGVAVDHEALRRRLVQVRDGLVTMAVALGLTLDDVMRANVEKRERRYPRGFVEGGGVR